MRRLSPAFLTIIMLGVVGLLVALYFGKRLLATQAPPPSDPLINVPMALTDLEPGTRITESHIGTGRSRESNLERQHIRSNRVLVGRIVKNPIPAAQPISSSDLYPAGEYPPLEVEPGMRAVTIPLGSSTAVVDGRVRPGQYVDVHFTPASPPDAETNGGMILTLFKGIKILAMNRSTSSGPGRSETSITLEVTPPQANVLLLSKDEGMLNLSFTPEGKGSGGIALDDEDRATLFQILGVRSELEPDPDPPFRTELFSGAGREVRSYRDGELIDSLTRNLDRNRRPPSNRIVPDDSPATGEPPESEPSPEEQRNDSAPPRAESRPAPSPALNAFFK